MADDARFEWFADVMGVRAGERVLEVGPGPGASLARMAERLGDGRIVGVERSATALARAGQRCADEVAAGRIRLVQGEIGKIAPGRLLGELDPGEQFDLIYAVNVNLFWTSPAPQAWATIRACLSPTGRLWLCYGYGTPTDAPTSPKPSPTRLTDRCAAAGFTGEPTTSGDLLAVHLTHTP
ncbi:class I SAM-dependent methyltransferase [Nocardia rosealba]|uniref:class I SAM-dependent methyltransferase n=1 Tax=Nocardia rosealba TaxID=2878563 RepID=UPI001CD9CB88|nr:class I SAM-dependent methyltransferase [Nocardia rosealba]MCA2209986.1 class I SAM-dependent methyltransferase [Nocardia rosealba]